MPCKVGSFSNNGRYCNQGPAAKMMSELGIPSTATEVARHYLGLIDGIVIDEVDRDQASQIERDKALCDKTVMSTLDDK